MSTGINGTAIGQQTPTQFVHRAYEESHVRFRLVTVFENDHPSAIVVDCRLDKGRGLFDFEHSSQVFHTDHFMQAVEVFKGHVRDYMDHMRLPA